MNNDENVLSPEDDIDYYFRFNIKLLSHIGLRLSMNKKTDQFSSLHKLPTHVFLVTGVLVFLIEISLLYDIVGDDTLLLIQLLGQLVSNLQSVCKSWIIINKINDVQYILEKLVIMWKKYPVKKNDRNLLKAPKKIISLTKIYWAVGFTLILIYYLQPILTLYTHYRNPEKSNFTYDFSEIIIHIKNPFNINRKYVFYCIFFQEVYLIYISFIYWIFTDSFFAHLATHTCLHLKILKRNAKDLYSQGNDETHLNFISFIRRHQEIIQLCNMIEDIYSLVIFSTTLLSAINMCVNIIGFKESISRKLYIQAGVYLFLFLITFAQICLYCVFSEKLKNESTSLADTIYNLDWYKDCRFRHHVMFLLLKVQKGFCCTAYGFFPIDQKKLASIIKSSFSYYMMLEAIS